MGYIAHNAIVVTSWSDEAIEKAHAKATELGCLVTNITKDGVNGYRSFLIAPDGSKEGWDRSAKGDEQRAAFRAYTESTRYEDGSGPLSWVEIRYGSDDHDARIVAHAWRDEVMELTVNNSQEPK